MRDRRMRLPRIVLPLSFLILVGSIVYAAGGSVGYIPELSCREGPYSLQLPKSMKALRSLGNLEKDEVYEIEDSGAKKIEHRELTFNGLRVLVITVGNQDAYVLEGVVITDSKWKILPGFRVGDTEESIQRRLGGQATRVDDGLEIGGDADHLRFKIFDKRVIEIIFSCYTG